MNTIGYYLTHPSKVLAWMLSHYGSFLPDKLFLKIAFRLQMGKKLNLGNPKTFNEKLQWLKLYDRKPEYTIMVDKYLVKKYIADIIGEKYIIPTLGVWNSVDEIDFDKLPQQFVLKCNHNSGVLVICKDKSKLDIASAKRKMARAFKQNFYKLGREWPYKDVKRKIIAEKYMEDSKTSELRDYKFFCFDGNVKALFIASERQSLTEDTKFDFFDVNFKHLPCTNGHPNAVKNIQKPICFEEMKKLASSLSKGIPHVRVDFYEVDGKVYFGELTFYHWSGFVPFNPPSWDNEFGSWINLPKHN